MARHRSDRAWQSIGAKMPYFGVLTADRYRPENLDQEAIAEFFASGEKHVDLLLASVERHFGRVGRQRCLDFGAGVGRVAIPLARRFEEVVAADVSAPMLAEAARNCARQGIANLRLVRCDEDLYNLGGEFDLVHSHIVFQHIHPRRGEKIFRRLLDLLTEGGVGVLHFATSSPHRASGRLLQWARCTLPGMHRLTNLLRRRNPDHPYMAMYAYQVDRQLRALQEHGCDEVVVRPTDDDGVRGVVLMFRLGRRVGPAARD